METKDMLKDVLGVYGKPLVRLITDLSGKDGQEVLLKYQGPLGQLLINLSGENGEEVLIELKKFNRKEPCYATVNMHLESKMNFRKKRSILHCIYQGKNLSIGLLDGSRLICDAKDTFESGIDSDFVRWGMNSAGITTPETLIQIHEMVGDSRLIGIFKALPGNWNHKWLSQNQVISFCETFPNWLRQSGNATMFLVKKDENKPIEEKHPQNNLVVVYVSVKRGDFLHVRVVRLNNEFPWNGEDLHRVVSPQLTPSVV